MENWLHCSYTWMRRLGFACQRETVLSSPGRWAVAVQHLDVIVQLVQLAHLPPRQRAVLTGEQQVGKLHDRLLPQTVALAVAQIVVLVLGGIAQQRYVVALPQHKIQSFNGTALPDMHPQLLAAGCLLQKSTAA